MANGVLTNNPTINQKGDNLFSVDPITIPAFTGVQAIANATIQNGRVQSISLSNAGQNYSGDSISITIATPSSSQEKAEGTIMLVNRVIVQSISLSKNGKGYDPLNPPKLTNPTIPSQVLTIQPIERQTSIIRVDGLEANTNALDAEK